MRMGCGGPVEVGAGMWKLVESDWRPHGRVQEHTWNHSKAACLHTDWKDVMMRCLYGIGMSNYSGAAKHGWNDMDMVFTGLADQQPPGKRYFPGQTHTEYVTEFSMWALLQSPLVWTGDVRNMSDFQRAVLLNFDVLAVHNDTSAPQGDLIGKLDKAGDVQVWRKLINDRRNQAVVVVNLGETAFPAARVTFEMLGLSATTQAIVTDLWSKVNVTAIGAYPQAASGRSLDPHACFMVKVFPLPI
eukprot:scpid81712/ scgid3968/ Alpha-galactosidase; Alpha-D-galactoside galactohydrolase; Melibiase